MGTAFKVILGLSPVLGFVIYLVYQEMQKTDLQINDIREHTQMEINTFNRDFEVSLAEMSDNEHDERRHLINATVHAEKNQKILDKRKAEEEALKEMEQKSKDTFAAMEAQMKAFDLEKEENK